MLTPEAKRPDRDTENVTRYSAEISAGSHTYTPQYTVMA